MQIEYSNRWLKEMVTLLTQKYAPILNLKMLQSYKITRALEIILVNFIWFDSQFLSLHACYKQYKA